PEKGRLLAPDAETSDTSGVPSQSASNCRAFAVPALTAQPARRVTATAAAAPTGTARFLGVRVRIPRAYETATALGRGVGTRARGPSSPRVHRVRRRQLRLRRVGRRRYGVGPVLRGPAPAPQEDAQDDVRQEHGPSRGEPLPLRGGAQRRGGDGAGRGDGRDRPRLLPLLGRVLRPRDEDPERAAQQEPQVGLGHRQYLPASEPAYGCHTFTRST